MKVIVWIEVPEADPFGHQSEVEDETAIADCLRDALEEFHVARPGQSLFNVPIRIEQHP